MNTSTIPCGIVVGKFRYIASLSCGKDSLAMVLKIMEEKMPLTDVVMYDAGMEFQSIYNNLEKIEPMIESYGAKLKVLRAKNNFYHDMLIRRVNKKDGSIKYGYDWCGRNCRWQTTYKVQAINKYLKSIGEYIQYIGIAFDEPKRIKEGDNKKYPLVDWRMTEKYCLKYCYDNGWNWEEKTRYGTIDLYQILDRVSCWCCWNKNIKELKNIRKYLPEYWDNLLGLQSRIDRPFKDGISLFDLDKRFAEEERQITMEEIK